MTQRQPFLVTSVALLALAFFASVLTSAAPARALSANGHGPGYLSADGWWLGTYSLDDGSHGFCLNAGKPSPTGSAVDYVDGDTLGWYTPEQGAALAYISRTWAGTARPRGGRSRAARHVDGRRAGRPLPGVVRRTCRLRRCCRPRAGEQHGGGGAPPRLALGRRIRSGRTGGRPARPRARRADRRPPRRVRSRDPALASGRGRADRGRVRRRLGHRDRVER